MPIEVTKPNPVCQACLEALNLEESIKKLICAPRRVDGPEERVIITEYKEGGCAMRYSFCPHNYLLGFERPKKCPNPPGAVEIQCTSKRSN